jgi:hypothetical protein
MAIISKLLWQYLLAWGASRSQFDVLNQAGFTLSYTGAISKIKHSFRSRDSEALLAFAQNLAS